MNKQEGLSEGQDVHSEVRSRPNQLILIRHGESARNKAKKHSTYFADDEARKTVKGIADHNIPLTEEGMRQAQITGCYMRDRFKRPDYVYHSGYLRTIETCDGVLSAYPEEERKLINVRRNLFIRERDPGFTYDMTEAEAEANFPWLRDYWITHGGFFAQPPGGQSLAELALQTYLVINMLFRDRGGKNVWLFTHGGTIRSIRFNLERWDYKQASKWPPGMSPKNCGITVYDHDQTPGIDRLVLKEYNTVAPY